MRILTVFWDSYMERNWEGREEIKSALGQSAESCSQCVCWHWREYRIPWWCTKLELLNFFLHSLSLLVSEICFWLFTGSVFPPFITCILFAAKIMCLKVKKTKGGWWQASCFFIIFREWLLFAKYVTHSCILQSWNLCSWESNNNNKKMLPCWQQAVSGLWALWLPTWIPPSEELPLVLGGYQGCVSTTTHYSWRVGVFASSKVR